MILKKVLLLAWFISFLITLPVYSQDDNKNGFSFSGKVFEKESGENLEGANVYIEELNTGTVSDETGYFHFEYLEPGNYTIRIRFVGYNEVSDTIKLISDIKKEYFLEHAAIKLSDVLVEGKYDKSGIKGSNKSSTLLSREEIDKHRGQSFGENLKKIPGVTVIQTGPSISKPVIRGFHSQRVLLLNNGIRQEGQQWGSEHAPEIDPFIPSRIEVLKGASSLEYGADAIGGTIRIIPLELPYNTPFAGSLTLNGFSNNLQGSVSGLAEGSIELVEGLGYRIQGSIREAGDSHTPDYNITNTGFKERNGSVTIGLQKGSGSFEAFYSHFGSELGIYSGSHIGNKTDLTRAIERGEPLIKTTFTYDIKPPKQEISHDLAALRSKINFNSFGLLELDLGWQRNHRQEFDAHTFYNDSLATVFRDKPAFDLVLTSYTLDARLRHAPINNLAGTIGINVIRQGNVSSGTSFLIPNFRVYGGGIFLNEELILDKWILNGGLRYDYRWMRVFDFRKEIPFQNTHTYNNISGAAGALFNFAAEWSLGFNIGTAWRPPGINELYSKGVHHGTANYEIGDTELNVEKSYNADLILRHISEKVNAEVSLFNYYFFNYIHLVPQKDFTLTIRGSFPTFKYEQVDADVFGIDGYIKYFVTHDLWLSSSIAVVRGKDITNNRHIIFIPPDRLNVTTHLHFSDYTFFTEPYVELSVDAAAKQTRYPADVDFADPPPGYITINLSAGSDIMIGTNKIKINLSAYNLFNKKYKEYLSRYRYYIDDPGFNFVLRIQVPFGYKK